MMHLSGLKEELLSTTSIASAGLRRARQAPQKLVVMYSHQSDYKGAPLKSQQNSSPSASAAKEPDVGAYEDLFNAGPDADMKAGIVAHPLQLLAAHLACLRVGTPREEQHLLDSALASQRHQSLLSHLQSLYRPAENQELNQFMVNYIHLLLSFKDQILEHLQIEASNAIFGCHTIEKEFFNLTGVSSRTSHLELCTMRQEDEKGFDGKLDDELGTNYFLPCDLQKTLRDHMQRELKQELKEDYHTKLKDVRNEILRKRRSGKLPKDTTHLLKDWWISHTKWPYPTEEEKAQLMEETGLDLKQINNWFINKRKRNWQMDQQNNDSSEGFTSDTNSCTGATSLS